MTGGPPVARHSNEIDWLGSVRGMAGYTIGNTLFFGSYGLSGAHFNLSRTQIQSVINSAPAGTIEKNSKVVFTWTAGAGIVHHVSNRWAVTAEYLYMPFQSTITWPIANRTHTYDPILHLVRIGVNYRF